MKRFTAAFCGIIIAAAGTLPASAYSQQDIYASADMALDWIVSEASPIKQPESSASDNAVMALSRMNKGFDFNRYLSFTQSRNPSTDKDGQRLIMTETACGSKASDGFVRLYTYGHIQEDAADLSGAIITLDSGGYSVKSDETSIEHMVLNLLSMQQPDGSFGGDVYTSARSVIALSFHRGSRYDVTGADENESYSYSTETAIANALGFLAGAMGSDHGFSTFTNTATVVMALDSVGVNAERDERFSSNGISPITWIMSQQALDGSFNSSPDDTALAACALVSHIRALQGKSGFFRFTSADGVNVPGADSADSPSGSSASTAESREATAPTKTDPPVIKLTPLPTRAPQHSELDEEEYGPVPPVGPIKPGKTDMPDKPGLNETTEETGHRASPAAAVLIIIALLFALLGGAILFMYFRYPEKLREILAFITKKTPAKESPGIPPEQQTPPPREPDIISGKEASDTAVSTEELYDPDFIKKLIPVDELDDTLSPIVPEAGADDGK